MVFYNVIGIIYVINNVFLFLIIYYSREKEVNRRISFYYWERFEGDFILFILFLKECFF